jgi:soluble lytic murein transglycosylase
MPRGEEHMRAYLKRAEKSGARHTIADSLWLLAMHAYKHQRYKDALPLFERYAATAEGAMVRARGLYWAGRAAALSGKSKQALERFREVLAVEPLHWYSLLARGRMRDLGEEPGPPFSAAISGEAAGEIPVDLRNIPLPDAARFYAELGLREEAVKALRAQEQELRARRPDGLLRLILAYHALGEFSRPFHLAASERDDVIFKPPTPEHRPIWDALFPRPYAEEVARAASQSSVSSALVYAVMRKESGFNPTVVSYADAIGLMQLIEPTAKSNALDMGITDFERDQLYKPAINVQLGSHYLAKLIAHYQGEAVPAIAAYNAGEHKVDPWLKRARRPDKHVELDYFVEDIPFEQTRNYVKGVVSSWARYAYLEKPGKDWPLELSLRAKL